MNESLTLIVGIIVIISIIKGIGEMMNALNNKHVGLKGVMQAILGFIVLAASTFFLFDNVEFLASLMGIKYQYSIGIFEAIVSMAICNLLLLLSIWLICQAIWQLLKILYNVVTRRPFNLEIMPMIGFIGMFFLIVSMILFIYGTIFLIKVYLFKDAVMYSYEKFLISYGISGIISMSFVIFCIYSINKGSQIKKPIRNIFR